MAAAASPNLGHGFPTPGPQDPDVSKVMDHVFFQDEKQWKASRETENYDFIVVGTGFCALGFVHRALENNPTAKILVVERGSFFLPEHFQNLPASAKDAGLSEKAETFPWTVDARTHSGSDGHATWCRGALPFFGGRSTIWSTWCPRPTDLEMDGWPDVMKASAKKEFAASEALLNVQKADAIDKSHCHKTMEIIQNTCKRPVYRYLQDAVQSALRSGNSEGAIPGIYRVDPAPMASQSDTGVDFEKFGVPGPFLELLQNHPNLHIATNVTVRRIIRNDILATSLNTSRGILPLGNAKLVLAMGCLPPTTLIQSSFPELPNIGKRFSGHFQGSITARIKKEALDTDNKFGKLEVGAFYVAGLADKDYKKQYHIQLTALYDENPEGNYLRAFRYMPDVVAMATREQTETSVGYVVLVCAILGEVDYRTEENGFVPNPDDTDPTTSSRLRVKTNGANDISTLDGMFDATLATLDFLSKQGAGSDVEYWQDGLGWTTEKPSAESTRADFVFHESSTMHAGHEDDAPVCPESYKVKGTDNVYITGSCLFPQSGSWNPTMTMTALAMDLADKLSVEEK